MRFRDCIFDLYGTLVDIHTDEGSPELWGAMAAHYRKRGAVYSPRELNGAYLAAVRRMERGAAPLRDDAHEAHPEIQLEYVFQTLYRERGADASLEDGAETGRVFRRLSTAYIRLYPGARELLEALRAAGRRVWLLSNAQAIFTRDELAGLQIADLFDGVYLSSDYGVKKPDRRFFDVLLRERRITPDTAVMVGNDGLCDIAGAQALGLATVYIHSNLSPSEPTPHADFVLEAPDLPRVQKLLLQ